MGGYSSVKFILDTNVYIEAASSDLGWKRFEQNILPLLPFVYLSSVVAFELLLAGRGENEEKLLAHHLDSMAKVNRLVAPAFEDWITAASAAKNKKLRSQLCDILIALSTRQIGAMLFTFNHKDFLPLSKKFSFRLKEPW
jgi:predicted nucleic acid-binding protein